MELFNQMIAGAEIVRGRIINIGDDGKLTVKTDAGGMKIACDFLRTNAGPLPELYLGTPVLCIAGDTGGYVLGVIQPFIVRDEDGKKADPAELNLKAKDSIELTCGESTLSMSKNGKIVLRGSDITSRSSGPNKIKGASVNIN